jgi:hypothetical protein
MKNLIESSEIKRILEMHSNYKKSIIKEQGTDIQAELQKVFDSGCIQNAKGVVSMKSSSTSELPPASKFAIKQESAKNQGKFRYWFFDGRVGYMDGGTFKFLSGKWSPQSCFSQVKKQQSDKDVSLTKQEGGWKKREDINDTQSNIDNPQMYDKKTLPGGEVLYREKFVGGITSGLTQNQQIVIQKWKDKGYKLKSELNPEEIKGWVSILVSPKSEGIFSEDLIMYQNPGEVKVDDITKAFDNAIQLQTLNKKTCKANIEAFYIAWKKNMKFEPSIHGPMKNLVQTCSDQFDFKGLFDKTDKYVDILTGRVEGGPAQSSLWRLND